MEAISENNNLTSRFINEAAKKIAGVELKAGHNWTWCYR